jgi:hypothetical protein
MKSARQMAELFADAGKPLSLFNRNESCGSIKLLKLVESAHRLSWTGFRRMIMEGGYTPALMAPGAVGVESDSTCFARFDFGSSKSESSSE